MKKIININLASRLIPIEDSAYEILRQYLDSLKRYFAREEGADEIVSDIESRIAELFQDKLKKGAHCITDDDVREMKAAMGTPEQFEGASETKEEGPSQDPFFDKIRPRKRLYRDPESKVLGGVCGGLGAYLNVDPIIFRIIFALLAVGGFGTGILIYFILWVATPEANTATEKLEMRGERIDVNNIRATVQDEIHAMKSHLKNVGEDMRNFSQGRGRQVGNDIERFVRNLTGGMVNVTVSLTKGLFYFFVAITLLVLFAIGIVIAVASPVLLPLKDLLLVGPLQSVLFWPAIFLLIGIPIVGMMIFLIRKLTGVKETNRFVGYSLSFLWFVGVICAFLLVVSIGRDFQSPGLPVKEKVDIMQPSGNSLVLKLGEDMIGEDDLNFFEGGLRITEDTVVIGDVRLERESSPNNNFEVVVKRTSHGRSMSESRRLAQEIKFPITQQDSVLFLPAGFSIPRDSKYRGQDVRVIIRIPANKKLDVDYDVRRRYHTYSDYDNRDQQDDDNDNDDVTVPENSIEHHENIKKAKENNKDSLQNNYRYEDSKKSNTTPVEDSGKHAQPLTQTQVGINAVIYSVYNLIR
jgi:phage shock protein C